MRMLVFEHARVGGPGGGGGGGEPAFQHSIAFIPEVHDASFEVREWTEFFEAEYAAGGGVAGAAVGETC